MSYGVGPFGAVPFGVPAAALPSENRSSLPSSRLIDGKTRLYVQNVEGGFKQMDDVAQRVLLLLSYGVKEPSIIGDSFESEMRTQILNALKPLTGSKEPTIKVKKIEVTRDNSGNTFKYIEYFKFTTDTLQVLEVT